MVMHLLALHVRLTEDWLRADEIGWSEGCNFIGEP